jgi:hypothetical protein
LVYRQATQVAQRRVAGAKVIQREGHAHGLERLHLGHHVLHVGHQNAFGQFNNVNGLAAETEVSRKSIYQQRNKAQVALDSAFAQTSDDDGALFSLPVTKPWLQRIVLALTLICHSAYRGGQEFMRDILGVSISLGGVHNPHRLAIQRARGPHQPAHPCSAWLVGCAPVATELKVATLISF